MRRFRSDNTVVVFRCIKTKRFTFLGFLNIFIERFLSTFTLKRVSAKQKSPDGTYVHILAWSIFFVNTLKFKSVKGLKWLKIRFFRRFLRLIRKVFSAILGRFLLKIVVFWGRKVDKIKKHDIFLHRKLNINQNS